MKTNRAAEIERARKEQIRSASGKPPRDAAAIERHRMLEQTRVDWLETATEPEVVRELTRHGWPPGTERHERILELFRELRASRR
ncbi:MAG: hypothetical protein EPN33_02015 [Acidobacteria bacterium]|nr:MAG: hypothetical protein EPN33_02015 [Acidobacteriota bacterium]